MFQHHFPQLWKCSWQCYYIHYLAQGIVLGNSPTEFHFSKVILTRRVRRSRNFFIKSDFLSKKLERFGSMIEEDDKDEHHLGSWSLASTSQAAAAASSLF